MCFIGMEKKSLFIQEMAYVNVGKKKIAAEIRTPPLPKRLSAAIKYTSTVTFQN